MALRIAPDLLTMLSPGRRIAVVSGTNGKTTTTRMLTLALETMSPVQSNRDGSNLARGVVTSLMSDPAGEVKTCAFEVDELALDPVARDARPDVFVLCNLSRDQLDRMTEVRVVIRVWQDVLARAAAQATAQSRPLPVVVANADDPMVVASVVPGPGAEPTLPVIWVSVGQPWRADAATCPRCSSAWEPHADYACAACGFARPSATWRLAGPALHAPGGVERELNLALPGRANRANAVMAVAAAAQFGVDIDASLGAIRRLESIGGRYASVAFGDAQVRLLLAKNPAGWQELLNEERDRATEDAPPGIVLSLNARSADGGDTSWIWDVPFEQLAGRRVYACGERAEDLAVRLRYAGVEHVLVRDPLEAVTAIVAAPGQPVDLLANYTAFTSVRRRLGAG